MEASTRCTEPRNVREYLTHKAPIPPPPTHTQCHLIWPVAQVHFSSLTIEFGLKGFNRTGSSRGSRQQLFSIWKCAYNQLSQCSGVKKAKKKTRSLKLFINPARIFYLCSSWINPELDLCSRAGGHLCNKLGDKMPELL